MVAVSAAGPAGRVWSRVRQALLSPPIAPAGMHHYWRASRRHGSRARIHLRVHADGTGMLLINAASVVHLNRSATEIAKLVLDGRTLGQTRAAIRRRYRGATAGAIAEDYGRVHAILDAIDENPEACPAAHVEDFAGRLAPFGKSPAAPYRVDLALTYKCQNRCPHCYVERDVRTPSLEDEQWLKVIDRLAAIGVPHVCFTGGDPSMYPGLDHLVRHAESLGILTGVITHGRGFKHPEFVDRLAAAGLDHVQITLESHDEAVHDAMQGVRGAWRETLQGVKNSLAAGFYVMTNSTLSTLNAHDVVETVDFLYDQGIRRFAMNSLIYSGGGLRTGWGLTMDELKSALVRVRDRANERGMKFTWYTPTEYCRLNPIELGIGYKRCTAGEFAVCIEPTGDVLPCQSFFRSAGNILSDDWQSVWQSELFRRLRDKALCPDKCHGCPDFDICGGGCPLETGAFAIAEERGEIGGTAHEHGRPQARGSGGPGGHVVRDAGGSDLVKIRRRAPLAAAVGLAALALVAGALVPRPAEAQSYSFRVPQMVADVSIESDGSAIVDYTIDFENSGRSIDVVDVGMPTDRYQISGCTADAEGRSLPDIRPSEYVHPGIEVHLGDRQIPSGQRAAVHVRCTVPEMVYEDTTDASYVSFRFTPTWFNADFVVGLTSLQVRFRLPGDPQRAELRWQNEQFDLVGEYGGRPMVAWQRTVSLTAPNLFGVSFPRRCVRSYVKMTIWRLAVLWIAGSPQAQILSGLALVVAFGIVFFRTTRGTGCSVFVPIAIGLVILLYSQPAAHLILWPAFVVTVVVVGTFVRRRRGRYLRAELAVEGGGIRRGLTAVEAAVLIEEPPGKVMSLLLFGMVKKELLRIVTSEPSAMRIDLAAGLSAPDALAAAKTAGVVVRPYEQKIVQLVGAEPAASREAGLDPSVLPLKDIFDDLVADVADKIAGHDLSDTRAYYRKIVDRALEEAKNVRVEERDQVVDRSFEWLLLDGATPALFRSWEVGGWRYHPVWWGPGLMHAAGTGSPIGLGGGGGGGGGPSVSLKDVASSIVGRLETAGQSFSQSIGGAVAGGAGVDLSGFDKVTGDLLKTFMTSGGRGGGGGGGCACAGCACACACAGGGR